MDFTEFINNYHKHCPFAGSLGLRLTAMSDGHVEGEIPITPTLFNPIGSIHGGVYYTLADTVGGCAARTRGQIPTTIEGKLNHIRAATRKDKKGMSSTSDRRRSSPMWRSPMTAGRLLPSASSPFSP